MPRILLVDDHPVVREGLGHVLLAALPDLVLGAAGRAADAMDCMRAAPWDLVLLDISLPDADGTDLLRTLRETWPDVPVLVVSMHPADQFASRATLAGAAGYVSKNSPAHELVRAARAGLAGERYVASGLEDSAHDAEARLPHAGLSDREYQVLRLIGHGRTVSEIAADLSISVKTVSTYRSRILEKMGMRTSAELMRYAISHRLVPWQAG